MLKFMRKYAKSYLIKIIFGVIIIVFIFYFGAGSIREKETVIAEVGSFNITELEYRETYNKEAEMFRKLYRDKMDDMLLADLKEKVLGDMINRYILLGEAKKLGISVSDQEFADLLGGVEAFQTEGKFDQERYVAVLKQNKLEPEQFEKSEKTMLLLRKVVSVIKDTGAPVSDADIWSGYVREKGKVGLAYSRFDPDSYKGKVSVSDKELNDIYEKEKERFRGENTYRLKFVILDGASGLRDDQAYMDLLKMKDIDAYGRQKGLTVSDTGNVRQSELFKTYKALKIEAWLKDLRRGDISLPVRDDGKSYIFQVVERQDGKPMEKSEALASLRSRIVGQKAKEMARLAAEDALKAGSTGKTPAGFVSRTASSIPRLGVVPKGDMDLLGLTKENPVYKRPVEINGDYYIFSFMGEQAPDRQEWEKNKEGFSRYYAARHKEQLLRSFIEESKQAMLKDGKIKILKNPKEL
ncbi:MAG: peptidylprolyl isomerase [Syntrophorhabdaceae bacterium]|nr:peptidylprolyl isomerase [Syntrophorhabdaceae bacterium]